jgi:hypothetical protein
VGSKCSQCSRGGEWAPSVASADSAVEGEWAPSAVSAYSAVEGEWAPSAASAASVDSVVDPYFASLALTHSRCFVHLNPHPPAPKAV